MKNHSIKLILVSFLIIVGFKPSLGQYLLDYGTVAGDLAKLRASETGEAFQEINDSVSYKNTVMKGRLRILKKDDSKQLTFIPIGKWIYSGSFPTISGIGRMHSRDTTIYDSLGNIVRRVYYNGKKANFKLMDKSRSEFKNGSFIEYTEYIKDGKVERSFYQRIVDYNIPKVYDQKIKIPAGTYTIYKNGKVKESHTFDTDGKLIAKEKHEH